MPLLAKSHISIIQQILYVWGPFGHKTLNLQDYDCFYRFFLSFNFNKRILILTAIPKKNLTLKNNSWERKKVLKEKSFTIQSHIISAIYGVTHGYKSSIKCEGIGFRLLIEKAHNKTSLRFKIGFSHDILITVPKSIIAFSTQKIRNECVFFSVDYQDLTNFTAFLSKLKRYNPYKRTGIIIKDKIYLRKEQRKK
jgi:ribosomal protein L6P/L9E